MVKDMSLITFKIIASVLIFIVALFAGILSFRSRHFHPDSLHLTDSITNGIFLGVAIFHMLPDAQEGFASLGFTHYPYALMLCFAGFIFLQIIKFITLSFNRSANDSKLNGAMIMIILCIHSIIEGATLGINTTVGAAFVIFIAIIAHKSCDSFALATTLKRYNLLSRYHNNIIILYALMTPFGIVIASTIMGLLSNNTGILTESSLNALAAGTFIYIGALDAIMQQFTVKNLKQNMIDFGALVLGMGLMGLLAIWI